MTVFFYYKHVETWPIVYMCNTFQKDRTVWKGQLEHFASNGKKGIFSQIWLTGLDTFELNICFSLIATNIFFPEKKDWRLALHLFSSKRQEEIDKTLPKCVRYETMLLIQVIYVTVCKRNYCLPYGVPLSLFHSRWNKDHEKSILILLQIKWTFSSEHLYRGHKGLKKLCCRDRIMFKVLYHFCYLSMRSNSSSL